MRNRTTLIGLILAVALVAAGCGSDDAADTTITTTTTEATTTTTAAPAETTTTTEAATTTTVAALDLTEVAYEYVSTIPDGWMAVSDIAAFKEGVAASNALLIDVRETGEYEAGHIEGAINIPIRTLAQNLEIIPTDSQVFVYCASGFRAGMALSALRMLGYDNVLDFSPGWAGWSDAGEPASTDVPTAETYAVPEIAPELLDAVDGFLAGIPDGFLSAGDVAKVKDAMDAGAFLLDVRTADEYAKGYIGDAINVDLRSLTEGLSEVPKDTQVIVYCGSGHRAALALTVLQVLGFDNARAFPGSYKAWTAAGEPVTTS